MHGTQTLCAVPRITSLTENKGNEQFFHPEDKAGTVCGRSSRNLVEGYGMTLLIMFQIQALDRV